ncbi:MAG: hypothetical protein QXJ22_01235 [Ignisphaera sp.]
MAYYNKRSKNMWRISIDSIDVKTLLYVYFLTKLDLGEHRGCRDEITGLQCVETFVRPLILAQHFAS